VDVVLKLNNDDTVYLQRIMDVTERKMTTGEEFIGKNSTDRFRWNQLSAVDLDDEF
jgi:hypothetical protein